jgi:hypothetical protein
MKIQASAMRAASMAQLAGSSGVRVVTTSATSDRTERLEAFNDVVTVTSARRLESLVGF